VTYVLGLRDLAPARRALTRAGNPLTEHLAYCYLAPCWRDDDTLRPVLCAFSFLVATSPDVHHVPGIRIGDFAAEVAVSGQASHDDVERKIIVAQGAPLSQLTTLIASLFRTVEAGELDFHDLFELLDSSRLEASKQIAVRQRLLESFYQHGGHVIDDPYEDLAAGEMLVLGSLAS
jgi:hypothetical protein